MKYLIALLIFPTLSYAYQPKKDWKVNKVCSQETRLHKDYCIEVIELPKNIIDDDRPALLLIPGLLQNAHIFDLAPEENVSLGRYIQDNFAVNIYILNDRLVGNSNYPANSSLEDLAIDDISMAVKFIKNKVNKKISIIGHSQGAITANMYLSGISRCKKSYCFVKSAAERRQKDINVLALMAGNNKLDFNRGNPLIKLAQIIDKLKFGLFFLDKINIEYIKYIYRSFDVINLWELLVKKKNLSSSIKKKITERTFQATSKKILLQYIAGLNSKELKTVNSIGISKAAKHIKVPTFHQTYEDDPFAYPKETYNDTFTPIGSKNKTFEVIPNLSHEDIFVSKNHHHYIDSILQFILSNT